MQLIACSSPQVNFVADYQTFHAQHLGIMSSLNRFHNRILPLLLLKWKDSDILCSNVVMFVAALAINVIVTGVGFIRVNNKVGIQIKRRIFDRLRAWKIDFVLGTIGKYFVNSKFLDRRDRTLKSAETKRFVSG